MDEKKLHKAYYHLMSALKEIKDIQNEIDTSKNRDALRFISQLVTIITEIISKIQSARKGVLKK